MLIYLHLHLFVLQSYSYSQYFHTAQMYLLVLTTYLLLFLVQLRYLVDNLLYHLLYTNLFHFHPHK